MATDMVAKDNMPVPTEATNHDLAPTNGSSKSDNNVNRRAQARGHLSSHLRDRAMRGPLKWNRSLTDVGFSSSKAQGKDAGNPACDTRKSDAHPTGAVARGQHHHYNLAYTYNHLSDSSLQSSARTKSRIPSSKHSQSKCAGANKGGEWTQKMTLTELRKFLNTRDGGGRPPSKEKGGSMPRLHRGMTLNIQRAVENYPNISLTVKDDTLQRASGTGKGKLHANPAKSRPQELDPFILPMLSHDQQNNAKNKQSLKADPKDATCLLLNTKSLGEANPMEWTKHWVQNNPLGPERNLEYHEGTPRSEHTLKSHGSSEEGASSSSPKSPRKVRFGTDKFLF